MNGISAIDCTRPCYQQTAFCWYSAPMKMLLLVQTNRPDQSKGAKMSTTPTEYNARIRPAPRRSSLDVHPSRAALLAARMRAGALDRALVEGADPAGSELLAARAVLLVSRRMRTTIAEGLERLEQAGRGPARRWSAARPREALRTNSPLLLELAQLLRGSDPVGAPGIAILSILLSDGAGPACHGSETDLARLLGKARAALHDGRLRGSV
jgi:hypothetical protein